MAMVVKNNMSAISTLNTLNKNTSALQKSLQKVSSGMKINSAQDDASGYAISERMRVMISSLDQANENTQNGSSLMKVAEGAVSNTVEILKTLQKKAINAATDTLTEDDRATIQKEIDQFVDQIDDNALVTFNGKYLLDGSKTAVGQETYGTLTNQALAEDTTALTKLTELYARNGEHLIIESTDKVTVSYVQGGQTYATTFQVGDNTFGTIFQMAEDIDESSLLFATASNESITRINGGTGTASTGTLSDEAIRNTISYLKSALGIKDSIGVTAADLNAGGVLISTTGGTYTSTEATTDDDGNTTPASGSVTPVTLSITALNSAVTAQAAGYNGVPAGSAIGIVSEYNGDLYNELKTAVDDYNNLLNEVGGYTSNGVDSQGVGVGKAYYLGEALRQQGIVWSGEASSLAELKDVISEAGGTLLEYYNQYQEAVSKLDSTKAAMDDAVTKYNNNVLQLDTLERVQEYASAKSNYLAAVDSYITEIKNKMSTNGTDTDFVIPAGVADNQAKLTYNPISDVGDAGTAKINAIAEAIQNKLYSLLENTSLPTEAFTTAVKTLLNGGDTVSETDGFYMKDNTADDPAAAAVGTVANVIGEASDEDSGTEASGAVAVVEAATALTATDLANLQMAYSDSLSQYTGPALLTGSQVGVDASNKIVTTLDGSAGITITAAQAGLEGQIAGFTISISDAQGNVRKAVDTALNSWTISNYAKNASTEDNSLKFHIGAKASQSISVDMNDMRAQALGLRGTDGKVVDVATKEHANAAISVFTNALQKALDQQTTIGAIEARLDFTSSNLTTASENVTAAESTIRDADMAKEMTNYTKNNVLLQAAQSMLAQANQNSSAVLSLLQ